MAVVNLLTTSQFTNHQKRNNKCLTTLELVKDILNTAERNLSTALKFHLTDPTPFQKKKKICLWLTLQVLPCLTNSLGNLQSPVVS